MSFAEQLRDELLAWWCAQEIQLAEKSMKKVHKQFNTRLGFPVTLCTPNRMSLTDSFKPWQKSAKMTNVRSDVTCDHCLRELEKFK